MMVFLKAQTVYGLLVLYAFHSFFVEMRSTHLNQTEQPKIIVKHVGDRDYIVKSSFSTFTTTQSPADVANELDYTDESIDSFCTDLEFECTTDRHCIPIEEYCDGKNDCSDKSDELTCASIPAIIGDTPTSTSYTSYAIIIIILLVIIIILMVSFKMYEGRYFLYRNVPIV